MYKNTFIDIRSLEKVNVREEEKQNTVKKGDILFTISGINNNIEKLKTLYI